MTDAAAAAATYLQPGKFPDCFAGRRRSQCASTLPVFRQIKMPG